MILNKKEKGIIDIFYNTILKYENSIFCLLYGTKKIECTFDTAYESDNNLEENDPNYEEYFALCFRNNISNQLFEVNYLNLPDLVYVDDNLIYKK